MVPVHRSERSMTGMVPRCSEAHSSQAYADPRRLRLHLQPEWESSLHVRTPHGPSFHEAYLRHPGEGVIQSPYLVTRGRQHSSIGLRARVVQFDCPTAKPLCPIRIRLRVWPRRWSGRTGSSSARGSRVGMGRGLLEDVSLVGL